MNFEEKIKELENESYYNKINIINGKSPVLLTSVHSYTQYKKDGTIKLSEPFTKAIAKYVAGSTDSSCMVKEFDDGTDSNSVDHDEFKKELIELVRKNNIRLVLDIHGANILRNFDVELGSLNNLSADFSTIRELKEAFEENGIMNIYINNPFKGGKITQYLFFNSNVDVIQIEINKRYRDNDNINNIQIICKSLICFINQYVGIISN